jgi:putative ABC transport system permease protein
VQKVVPDLPVFGVRTLEEVLAQSLAQRRFQLQMIGAFAAVALLLAAIGVYGLTAFWVKQRTQEIGIRLALGRKAATSPRW